ncbi:MAG: ComEA family DNA-binding protein [Phycisphaeraceae bacterium]
MTDRGRSIALFVFACVMLLLCFEQMGTRSVNQADVAATAPVTYRINVNRADADTLCLLPRVGPGIAQRVITTRQAEGKFNTPSDLTTVPMIGDKTAAALSPWVSFDE